MYKYPLSVSSSPQREREKREEVGKGESGYRCDTERSVGQEGFRQHQVTRVTKGSRKRERETERVRVRESKERVKVREGEREEASSDLLHNNLGSEPIK